MAAILRRGRVLVCRTDGAGRTFVLLIEAGDLLRGGRLHGQLGEDDVRKVRRIERGIARDQGAQGLQVCRRAAGAAFYVGVAIRAERPRAVVHERTAERQIHLALLAGAARATGLVRIVPRSRLQEESHGAAQGVGAAGRRDIDDAADAER